MVLLSLLSSISVSVSAAALESIPDSNWKTAKDVISFQPYAVAQGPIRFLNSDQKVTLTNLNKFVNTWFILQVTPGNSWWKPRIFNLESAAPLNQEIYLTAQGDLAVKSKSGEAVVCKVMNEDGWSGPLFDGAGGDPYVALCEGRLYLRNQQAGHKDAIAWGSTVLRDVLGNVGDDIVNGVKENLYNGKYFEAGQEQADSGGKVRDEGGPNAAQVSANVEIAQSGIGFDLDGTNGALKVGEWYRSRNFAGVFLSVMKAKYVAPEILKSYPDRVNPLDVSGKGESEALVNSIAIDLELYRFGWNNGTEHPGVGWSSRALKEFGPGPDGFADLSPLTFPGVVTPVLLSRTVGVLTGGFQRRHSAFKGGPLSTINRGSHYGFMEKGVLMSTIVPNLATFIVNLDGSIDLKTWAEADNERLASMRDIRQNGVALIETDPATGKGIPGPLVKDWVGGNWSGSAAVELKTPRTSMCIAERDGKRYLIVSYFSTHTPNGMARVLQAYGCKYAVHMDMNSPQFAYSAFFTATPDGDFNIEHLSNSMNDDVFVNGKKAPRSLLTPTYKDFFYVMKR